MRKLHRVSLPCLIAMACSGCSRSPSIEFVGSFFPAWMFCILAALLLTGVIRAMLVRCELEPKLGPLVVFYPGVTVALSCLLWLVLYS